jgi:hypothetical protein
MSLSSLNKTVIVVTQGTLRVKGKGKDRETSEFYAWELLCPDCHCKSFAAGSKNLPDASSTKSPDHVNIMCASVRPLKLLCFAQTIFLPFLSLSFIKRSTCRWLWPHTNQKPSSDKNRRENPLLSLFHLYAHHIMSPNTVLHLLNCTLPKGGQLLHDTFPKVPSCFHLQQTAMTFLWLVPT